VNPGPLDAETVAKIYQLILDESIRTQTRFGYDVPPERTKARAAKHGTKRKAARRKRR